MKETSHQNHLCRGKRQNSEQSMLIACEICGKTLSRGALKTHRTIFHSPLGTLFCRTCFKIFPCADTLNTHKVQCGLKSKVSLPCNFCGKILSSIKSLARHKISLHSTPGTVIFCKTCVKKFKTIDELNAHIPECSLRRKIKRSKKH